MIFPVITLHQPWATWVMRGWKTIETRTHNRFASLANKTILIHASMTVDIEAMKRNDYLKPEQLPFEPELPAGCILGSAYVFDFRTLDKWDSKSALIDCENTKRFGLLLQYIDRFENTILCKGNMGIWYFDMETKKRVKKENIEIAASV